MHSMLRADCRSAAPPNTAVRPLTMPPAARHDRGNRRMTDNARGSPMLSSAGVLRRTRTWPRPRTLSIARTGGMKPPPVEPVVSHAKPMATALARATRSASLFTSRSASLFTGSLRLSRHIDAA